MVDTYRADSSQEEFSTDPQSYDAEASRRPAYTTHDLEPALTHDGVLTTSAADRGEQICFSRTASSCSGSSLEGLSGT